MNLLYSNDAPGAYPASYYADSVGPQAERTSLEGEHNADVCIVGAGYTGLSAAYQLARRGYRVIVLEAHRVGWGASGRNGGQLGSGHRLDQMDLEARLGSTHAHALWELAQEAKATVRGYQAEFGAEFELKEGIIEANHRARYDEETKVYAAYLNEHLNYPARYLAPDELSDEVGSAAYSGGLLDPQAAHVHPLKLVLALGKGAEAALAAQIAKPVPASSGGQGAAAPGSANGATNGSSQPVTRLVLTPALRVPESKLTPVAPANAPAPATPAVAEATAVAAAAPADDDRRSEESANIAPSPQADPSGEDRFEALLAADAFDGHVDTVASVDFASKPLALSVQPNFDNIQIGSLLAAFLDS